MISPRISPVVFKPLSMKTIISSLLVLAITVSAVLPVPTSAASNSRDSYYPYTTGLHQQQMLQSYLRQLEQILAQLRALSWQYDEAADDDWYAGRSEVQVSTRSADDVEEDEATLRGQVDFGNSDEAVVYFQWGTARNRLNQETPNIVLDDSDDEDFRARIDDLDEDRTYYFRAVSEDEDGRRDYGSTLSLRSDDDYDNDDDDWDDDNDNDEEPDVETGGASSIRTSSAELRGEVDMNDYENGYVFLVYGEDEDLIDAVTDDYDQYADIDTAGDDLQKTGIYSGLDNTRTFFTIVGGLDEDTDIFYAYCVEYEDDDNDEVITCGDTESFTTDKD